MGEDFFAGTRKSLLGRKTYVMTKEQKEFWDKMSKIKAKTWKEMNTFMDHTKDIMASGGLVNFYKSQLMEMKDALLEMIITPIVAPILEALADPIADLVDVAVDLSTAVADFLAIELPGGMTLGDALGEVLGFAFKFIGIIPMIMNLPDLIESLFDSRLRMDEVNTQMSIDEMDWLTPRMREWLLMAMGGGPGNEDIGEHEAGGRRGDSF